MKYAKKKHNRGLIVGLVVASVLLAAMIGIVAYLETRDPGAAAETTVPPTSVPETTAEPETSPEISQPQTAPSEYTEPSETPTQAAETDLMVSTPYCGLFYPGELKEAVRTQVEHTDVGCVITFFGTVRETEVELFSVLFAEENDISFPVGTFTHEGVTLDVSIAMPDIIPGGDWDKEDEERANVLQEGVNYLLDMLKKNPAFSDVNSSGGGEAPAQPTELAQQATVPTQITEEPEIGDLKIATPYCNLYFPGQWKDSVRWEVQETDFGGSAAFFGRVNGREERLFTVFFAETVDEAVPLGILTVQNVAMDVSIALWELPENCGWPQEEQDLFYALQEKANYLMDKLRALPDFMPI